MPACEPVRRYRVLFADDDEDDALMAGDALADVDPACAFSHVEDGEALLAHLGACGSGPDQTAWPDLVLLDLNMPGRHGAEILAEIRNDRRLSGLPVVILSTSDAAADITECYRLGASGYIVKPRDYQGWISNMRSVVQYWFHTVRLPEK